MDKQLPLIHPVSGESVGIPEGRVGRARSGRYRGMFVEVERDPSGTGFHIWVLRRHPKEGPSEGWDIWADAPTDLAEWLGPRQMDVEWIE